MYGNNSNCKAYNIHINNQFGGGFLAGGFRYIRGSEGLFGRGILKMVKGNAASQALGKSRDPVGHVTRLPILRLKYVLCFSLYLPLFIIILKL